MWGTFGLGSGGNNPRDVLRQLHGYEIVGWVQVIFAGLVDHPEQLALRSGLIPNYGIELSQFQRRRMAIIADANHEIRTSRPSRGYA